MLPADFACFGLSARNEREMLVVSMRVLFALNADDGTFRAALCLTGCPTEKARQSWHLRIPGGFRTGQALLLLNVLHELAAIMRRLLIPVMLFSLTGCQQIRSFLHMDSNSPTPFMGFELSVDTGFDNKESKGRQQRLTFDASRSLSELKNQPSDRPSKISVGRATAAAATRFLRKSATA